MLKFILLLIALWLAIRLVGRLFRITAFLGGNQNGQNGRRANRPSSFSSSRKREAVEEAEYEVIDSQIKQKE